MRVLACLVLAGCAQVLGLDETRFEEGTPDAPIDAAGLCDGVPASCTSTVGRSICGQLYAPGGAPIRSEQAAPVPCESNGEGPCQYSVTAIAYDQYTTAAPGPSLGSIDTCGRWQVNDFDPTATRVVVLFDAPNHIQTASLVIVDTATSDAVVGQGAYAVSQDQLVQWNVQATSMENPITSTGYLVEYRTAAGVPSRNVQSTYDNMSPLMNPVGTAPWAAYFGGNAPFGSIATTFEPPGTPRTDASGTALTVVENTIALKGVREGARCTAADLHQVPGALIYLAILGC